jgi:hypothetical protein
MEKINTFSSKLEGENITWEIGRVGRYCDINKWSSYCTTIDKHSCS